VSVRPLPSWASKRNVTRYVVALDDSGQKVIRPSLARHSFLFGGVVFPEASRAELQRQWAGLAGERIELKKATFSEEFEGAQAAPAISEAVLSILLENWSALPFFLAFDKAETSPALTRPTRRGEHRIHLAESIAMIVATLSSFLERSRGLAEIVVDHMASHAEETVLQDAWCEQMALMRAGERKRLPETISFVDSQTYPEVQVADVLMGLLRASQEENRGIAPGLGRLVRKAEQQGLYGFHLS